MWRSIWRWHLRRRRFSEEWEFHRELLSTELRAGRFELERSAAGGKAPSRPEVALET